MQALLRRGIRFLACSVLAPACLVCSLVQAQAPPSQAAATSATPVAQSPGVPFSALEGWWRSELLHNGQQSEFFLHFVTDKGKAVVRVSAPELGAWDFPFGGVELSGNEVTLTAMKMPLTYDPAARTLDGKLPQALVPAYEIPVSFKRIETPAAPRVREWNHPSPTVVWAYETGAPIWAGLALDQKANVLYAGSDAGSMMAFDARNGALIWLVNTLGSIRAQPTPHEGMVYVVSDDGYLYKFDGMRGTERWRVRIDTSKEPRKPRGTPEARFDRYGSAATVDGRHVYVGSRDGNLYALDIETGREIWRAPTQDMITASPLVRNGTVIFGSHDNNVYAVRASDGIAVWQQATRGPVATDLALAGNRVLVGTRAYDLHALDAAKGTPAWNYYYWFSWIDSGPTVVEDIAYVGSSDATSVFAIDVRSGKLRWRSHLDAWCWPRTAVEGRHVYAAMVGGDAGFRTLRGGLVALDRRNGEVEWAFLSTPPQPLKQYGFASSPVATRDRVYAADMQGRVYAFQAEGRKKRTQLSPRRLESGKRVVGSSRN
jgi:outer membrane protein assembly factor BamB